MSGFFSLYGLNRTLCDVFEEMRTCVKTLNFSALKSLIEEAQSMANRMEAALADLNDLNILQKKIEQAKRDLDALEKELDGREDDKKTRTD